MMVLAICPGGTKHPLQPTKINHPQTKAPEQASATAAKSPARRQRGHVLGHLLHTAGQLEFCISVSGTRHATRDAEA